MEQLGVLTGRPVDGVSALRRSKDGWVFQVEVVELERIPATTSVLASYQVTADGEGNIASYARTERYYRNRAGSP